MQKDLKELIKIWTRSLDTINIEFEDRYKVKQRQKEKYIYDKKDLIPLRIEEIKKLLVQKVVLDSERKDILTEMQEMTQKSKNYQDLYKNLKEYLQVLFEYIEDMHNK